MLLGVKEELTQNCPEQNSLHITDYGKPYGYKSSKFILCVEDDTTEDSNQNTVYYLRKGEWYEVIEADSCLLIYDEKGNCVTVFNPWSTSKIFDFDSHFNLLSYKPESPTLEERINFLVRLYPHQKDISKSLMVRDEVVCTV
jgi:hypothetical protein